MKNIALVAAAGRGERLGGRRAKLWAPVLGKPLIYHSLAGLEKAASIDGVIVMARPEDVSPLEKEASGWGFKKLIDIYQGGDRRQDTTRIGIGKLPDSCEIVAIHDCARPLASHRLFERVVSAAAQFGAATAVLEPVDTVVRVNGDNAIEYLDRPSLRLIQTPQAFKVSVIRDAHQRALDDNFEGTDDAGLVSRLGLPVELVPGELGNFKITYPDDIIRLENLLA